MTEERHTHSPPPDPDQALDQLLASLTPFAPRPGFEDRVMARVRVPALPAVAPVPAPAARRRRWPMLVAPLAGVAAASSTALTAWTALHFGAITAWAVTSLLALGVPMWHTALAWLATLSVSAGSGVLAAAFTAGVGSWVWLAALLNLAVPVSLVGLVLVARPFSRKPSHAVR
jgi:hypothetical protein